MPAALPTRQAGHFRLVDLLGRGGMGEVYRAMDVRTGRVVAVKVVSNGSSQEVLQRFANEARLQATLHHPNVATLEDFFEWEGRPYLVLEYVDGETLADRLARGRLGPREALRIFRDIAAAAAYVHQKRVIHRDLKPTNIRITSTGVVKLLDFGIAKGDDITGLTRVGSVIGTPRYLSPEQLQHGESSPRSDVWALGVLLYEMTAGRLPFDVHTITELWTRVTSGAYTKLAELGLSNDQGDRVLVKAIDRIVARCLRVEPGSRFASAVELLDEVDDVLGGQGGGMASISGRAAALATTLAEVLAERWRLLTACAVVVLVLMGWLGLSDSDSRAPRTVATSPVRIDVVEGKATVFVNGQLKGQTPLVYQAGPDETVRLELRQPGFEPVESTFEITRQESWTFPMPRARSK
jgi:serine/threonine-protein kinase